MIVDSHIHIYDPGRPEGVPWPDPKDQIYRTVLPRHFHEIARPAGVTHAVIVEASFRSEDNQWVLDRIAEEPGMLGLVGNLDLGATDFVTQLGRFASSSLFLGIRARDIDPALLHGEPHRSHIAELARRGLSLDLIGREGDLPHVARVAEEHPELRIVIDHLGHPVIHGGEPDPRWKREIALCAGRTNVFCKVSRITEAAARWPAPTEPTFYRPVLQHLWDVFGADRLLWGSNWPVAERAGDYRTTLDVVTSFLAERSEAERDVVLSRASQAAYRWKKRG